jgi:hypothetical protein
MRFAMMLIRRILAFALLSIMLIVLPLVDAAEPKALSLADLYKSGDLFDAKKYTAVRAAFSDRFEQKHAATIEQAFGANHAELSAWLQKRPAIKQELFIALEERTDNIPAALALFARLWKQFPNKVEEHPALAIATVVVWDNPRAVYDYAHHQRRTKSKLPSELADAVANFEYLATADKTVTANLKHFPREFLAFVVDNRTPISERKWAQNFVKSQKGVSSWHQSVPYDMAMLKTEQTGKGPGPKLAGHDYTLENIKKYGGVCAQQADFVARIGKSLGQPSVYVSGESSYRGLHAWVMWVTVLRSDGADNVKFTLVSDGRTRGFEKDAFYVGHLTDPQRGEPILDRDMERRLTVVGLGARLRRQSELAMRAYDHLASELNLNPKQRLDFLDRVWKLSPYAEEAWTEFARLAKAGEIKGSLKTVLPNRHAQLMKTFAKWPDFIDRISESLMVAEEGSNAKLGYLKAQVTLYEKMQRPDLACKGSLKIAALLQETGKKREAATELTRSVRKFPTEGRFVPQLLKAYGDLCEEYGAGKPALAKLYLELAPALVRHYKGESNRFLAEVIKQGNEFLNANNYTKQAAQFRALTAVAGTER